MGTHSRGAGGPSLTSRTGLPFRPHRQDKSKSTAPFRPPSPSGYVGQQKTPTSSRCFVGVIGPTTEGGRFWRTPPPSIPDNDTTKKEDFGCDALRAAFRPPRLGWEALSSSLVAPPTTSLTPCPQETAPDCLVSRSLPLHPEKSAQPGERFQPIDKTGRPPIHQRKGP
jgi:hypothetical protein